MFRIRRIYDDVLPINQAAIREAQGIFGQQFPTAPQSDIEHLGEKLRNPFKQRFRTILSVAENAPNEVLGFAVVLHDPILHFCFLEYMAAARGLTGRGVGAALYEHVRDEALRLGTRGLFFECLPDEAEACRDPQVLAQNIDRMRFYERYGARPVVGTAYEAPVPGASADNAPHLMYDDLDRGRPLKADVARQVVRAVLERKYGDVCPPAYVEMVVSSFRDPVRLRELRYAAAPPEHRAAVAAPPDRMAVAISDRHNIHHIRERGYVESPVRIKAILGELLPTGLIDIVPVVEYPRSNILAVHDAEFVDYLEQACAAVPEGKSVYPYVFPIRNASRPPKDLSVRAGYYCIDTFTPISRNAFSGAARAVDCALTAAEAILAGRRVAYALVRPPGHHAERRSFGGFCYFNSAAIAAEYLRRFGRVAILDIDYHHGNGQQEIFYERDDILTVSIHGDPEFAYPYFAGFADECGAGPGEGYNVNLPLPEVQDGRHFRQALDEALAAVANFEPVFLVVALGFDPAKGDPTGTWLLTAKDFLQNGRMIANLELPTLVVQEGGYRTRTLGINARHFFQGLVARKRV